ncbi:MAG: translation initiation factor IF-2 [Rhodospirillaceae bacterium]|nr:translation initiation factor IF-2 [Rhodospirillaceae bacterium]
MTQKSEQEGKLSLNRPGTLELKKTVETGQVRQSFSHGRSKSVMVEVKKKRSFGRDSAGRMRAVSEEKSLPQPELEKLSETGNLTEEERAARMRAIHGAAEDAEKRRLDQLEDERRKLDEENKKRAQEEEEAKRRAEEEARLKAEEEARLRAEEEASMLPPPGGEPVIRKAGEKTPESEKTPRKSKAELKRPRRTKDEPKRRMQGKLTIGDALRQAEDGDEGRVRSLAAVRRAQERERKRQQAELLKGEVQQQVREVVVPETITVADLANRMAIRVPEVVKALMSLGVMAAANQAIDADTAELVVNELGHKIKRVSEADVELGLEGVEDDKDALEARAPVVTVMGHVDHGKTSLLDVMRQADVAAGEAGGITQHIGAYQVVLESAKAITFLDTPGHEAFTEMRARGAGVTDIVILVVAADDGVQPQTAEAISHAKAAEVPIIVAINKIDTPGADVNRVRNELLSHEIVVESLGGDVLDVEVSAKEKTNIDKLEEAILLQTEILELKANPSRPAQGTVVEAKMEQGRGSVATVLIQRGTLMKGDIFVAGSEWGRVRAMINDRGNSIDSAGPSQPVEVLGLQGTPLAGEPMNVVEDEGRAREVAEYRQRQNRQMSMAAGARGTLEQMFDQIKAGDGSEMPLVVKADVQGSLEAIIGSLHKIETDEAKVHMLHRGVGGITESDVALAGSSQGVIIGFNVRANPQARELAKRDNVDIRYYSIIYDVIDDMKNLLGGLLAPEIREKQIGYAEIREVFGISKVGKIGGCMVTEGEVKRGAKVRLLRDDVVIHEGSLKTLKRFKDDVREVQQGYECGMAFENYDDIKEGDMVECFEVETISRTL